MYAKKIRDFIEKDILVYENDTDFCDSDNLFTMGLVNSLYAFKIVNFIEQEFNIIIENEDLDIKNISSINNIESLIRKKLN